jgi:DNA (cytosine-5)-methyltransferase 1
MAGEGSGSRAKVIQDYRIRKLTPRECFRLQDFPDTFKFVVSNSQLYKQAGNSISANVMEMIFNQNRGS